MNTSTSRMPVLFVGHGSPMTAFEDNRYTRGWATLAAAIPKPRAILAISAHWYTRGTAVTAMENPRTVHDFSGFPDALYQYHYRAPGDPDLARQVADLLKPVEVVQDQQWGLDHGAWTVLKHMYPEADVPVLQLSIDATREPQWHYDLGRKLQPLRDMAVLVMGAGNVVHNLGRIQWNGQAAYPWAVTFDQQVRQGIETRNHAALIDYARFGEPAKLSVPTPEHYLPLLYVLGASTSDEPVQVWLDGITMGSISMMSVLAGDVSESLQIS